jgi:FAD/FMN-containing dehydrogenase
VGDAGYDEARRVWNGMIDRRPALIARCRTVADVERCVRFARLHEVMLTVRGGGHHIGGRAVADGALMVDLSQWREVRVDPTRGTVEVGPGATLGDLDAATAPHGVVVPTGIVSETGIAGLTLGGGFGWLSPRWGLTCDHLLEVQLVTGRGDVLTASETSQPDLMWALRGGGGGLGIVTSFRFRLRPLDRPVAAGMVVFRGEHAAEAVVRYREMTADAPDELGCMLKLGAAPAAPFLPEELHGTPVAVVIPCHSGSERRALADLEPLRRGGLPVADQVAPRPFAAFQSMFDGGEPKGRRDYWKSEYISVLDDELAGHLLEALRHLPSPAANLKVFRLGGEVARVPVGSTSAGHRDARHIVVVASAWDDPADDGRNIDWVTRTWGRVHSRSRQGGYLNFLTDDADAAERAEATRGVDLGRLARIRAAFDPDGVFADLPRAELPRAASG